MGLHGRGSRSGGVFLALPSERIFGCNHQRTPGLSKSRSLSVKRPSNTQECRTLSGLANVASRNLARPGAGIRRRAMSARGKTKLEHDTSSNKTVTV
jgi:hypothetical protein